MKSINVLLKLYIPILIICFDSCTEKSDSGVNFLNDQERLGVWVNELRNDTLDIKTSSVLIRHYDNTIKYNYRINDAILYIKLPDSETETEHMITNISNAEVTIQNMYIGIEETNNSGLFKKIH